MSTDLFEFTQKLSAATKEDRQRHGMRTQQNASGQNKYPIANRAQALSAIRLRHHAKPTLSRQELENLLRRAAKYAPQEASAARQRDHANGKL